MGKGYFRLDLLAPRSADINSLENALGRAGLSIENPIEHKISMFNDKGDYVPGSRDELHVRLMRTETFGMQWWNTEGVDLFCTIATLRKGHSLTFYLDGEIERSVSEVCDALMVYVRDVALEHGVSALCVDFDGLVTQVPTVACRFEGEAGKVPDIVGRSGGWAPTCGRLLASYRVGDLTVSVMTERALVWMRRFSEAGRS